MVLFEGLRWSAETYRGHFLLFPTVLPYRFLLLTSSDLLNMRLGWFLLVTMEVITVGEVTTLGSFSRSTLSDLLSRAWLVLAVLVCFTDDELLVT